MKPYVGIKPTTPRTSISFNLHSPQYQTEDNYSELITGTNLLLRESLIAPRGYAKHTAQAEGTSVSIFPLGPSEVW